MEDYAPKGELVVGSVKVKEFSFKGCLAQRRHNLNLLPTDCNCQLVLLLCCRASLLLTLLASSGLQYGHDICIPHQSDLLFSGEKQRRDRGYDFSGVVEWFAQRVDRILLLFDAHKLDISDEFRSSIEAMKGHEDKIRIVLNKADMVDHQELMRVYGALMWSLGKVQGWMNGPPITS